MTTQQPRVGSLSNHDSSASRDQWRDVERQLRPRGLLRTMRRIEGVGKRRIVFGVDGGGVLRLDGGDGADMVVQVKGKKRYLDVLSKQTLRE